MRALLRLVVMKGTGKKADAPGYRVGGKTGTAQKLIGGRYSQTINVTSFAGVFPMDEPRYVIVVMLDEPKATPETFGFTTAGWNVAPVVSRTVSRIAPMLGVAPDMNREPNMAEVLPFVHETKRSKLPVHLARPRRTSISDSEVTGFAIDHRKVAPRQCVRRVQGRRFNGEDFIADAIERGAVAVVARPEAKVEGVPHLADAEPRRLFAELAAKFYAPYPETVVAVTGTNGKTSTVEMTRQMWRMAGHRSASIGTLGVTTADDQVKTGLTTPDIVTFLNNMAGLKRMGISHVAYEASSHGLDQYRAEGVPVAAAAFTNFSRDHLDYHPTWTPISRPRCGCSTKCVAGGRHGGDLDRRSQIRRSHRAARSGAGSSCSRSAARARPSAWSSRRRPRSARRWCSSIRRQGPSASRCR